LQESGEAKAERLVREVLGKLGGTKEELGRRRKGDAGKCASPGGCSRRRR
jgi:hypothetical protein